MAKDIIINQQPKKIFLAPKLTALSLEDNVVRTPVNVSDYEILSPDSILEPTDIYREGKVWKFTLCPETTAQGQTYYRRKRVKSLTSEEFNEILKAPPFDTTQYEKLNENDIIRYGDEFWNGSKKEWKLSTSVGQPAALFSYRRPKLSFSEEELARAEERYRVAGSY